MKRSMWLEHYWGNGGAYRFQHIIINTCLTNFLLTDGGYFLSRSGSHLNVKSLCVWVKCTKSLLYLLFPNLLRRRHISKPPAGDMMKWACTLTCTCAGSKATLQLYMPFERVFNKFMQSSPSAEDTWLFFFFFLLSPPNFSAKQSSWLICVRKIRDLRLLLLSSSRTDTLHQASPPVTKSGDFAFIDAFSTSFLRVDL